MSNVLKTAVLFAALTGLLMLIGSAIGGTAGIIVAFGFAAALNMGAWWYSDKIALKFSGAKPADETVYAELHRVVGQLAGQAGVPKPRVYVIDSAAPNAFATGRDPAHGAVAVTTGLMQIMNRSELAGVIAHELAHIRHRDTLIASVTATVAGAISMIADMIMWSALLGGFGGGDDEEGGGLVGGLAMLIIAPIAAVLIQLAISRSREFSADAGGAAIMGDPHPLADALEKLDEVSRQRLDEMKVRPAMAHQYIVNPLAGGAMIGLFRTHPPTEERVRRLRQMSAEHSRMVMA